MTKKVSDVMGKIALAMCAPKVQEVSDEPSSAKRSKTMWPKVFGQCIVPPPAVKEVSGNVASKFKQVGDKASATYTGTVVPKINEVRSKASVTCTDTVIPKLQEVKSQASTIYSDTVLPKLQEIGGKVSETCADTMVPKLKEVSGNVALKLKEVSWKAAETCKPKFQELNAAVVSKLQEVKGKASTMYTETVMPGVQEISGKVAVAICTPKVKEVSGMVESVVCAPKVKEVTDKAVLKLKEVSEKAKVEYTDTVMPKIKEVSSKASVTCTDTVVPQLKEKMTKVVEKVCNPVKLGSDKFERTEVTVNTCKSWNTMPSVGTWFLNPNTPAVVSQADTLIGA